MIVGRAAELRVLDELLQGLLRGGGGALLVHGEPGIGKTTLLEVVAERCGDDVTVLRGRGAEMEAELAFSLLADVLGPILGARDTLPGLQRTALEGALALGPPAPGDRLAVCVAALGVLRAAAARRPVLAIVDDVHWADACSRECIEYVARRVGAGVGVVLAARDPWDGIERSGLPRLPVAPLDEPSAAELLRAAMPSLAMAAATAIVESAAGNPLALVELPATLTADQRAGVATIEAPLAPGNRLQHAFATRIEALDEPARRALLIAAAEPGGDLATITAGCEQAATDIGQLVGPESAGLVRLGAAVTFAHPLVRGAAYTLATPAQRRAAHAALARVTRAQQRSWHLASATVGPDDDIAADLARLGAEAAGRRAYAAASAAFERAAALTRDDHGASERLLLSGGAAAAAGAPDRALTLVRAASRKAVSPATRRRAEHLAGRTLIWSGRASEATPLLVAEAEAVTVDSPELAATILADAACGETTINSYVRAERLARRAVDLLGADGDPSARLAVLATFAWVLALRGLTPEARPALAEVARLADGLDGLGSDWPWIHLLLRTQVVVGDFEAAQRTGSALCERAYEAGALATLSGALLVSADAAFRLGAWPAADAGTLRAARVGAEAGQPALRGFALVTRARLLAASGREQESLGVASEALAIADSGGISSGLRFVHAARGFLDLSLDRVPGAIDALETVARLVQGSGLEDPTVVPWAPDLIEAYARGGQVDAARGVLAMLERQAASTESDVAAAAAARCRGILASDFDPAFAAALAADDRRPMPFERARTLLAYGRRLHRARRRAEARERLREAVAGFDHIGAAAWADQARHELRAAGARRRAASTDTLTSQEQRVADAVRDGMSNREIAAALYLSPKTIEFHLRQIYRKLGIHSRTQLVTALPEEGSALKAQ